MFMEFFEKTFGKRAKPAPPPDPVCPVTIGQVVEIEPDLKFVVTSICFRSNHTYENHFYWECSGTAQYTLPDYATDSNVSAVADRDGDVQSYFVSYKQAGGKAAGKSIPAATATIKRNDEYKRRLTASLIVNKVITV